MRQLRVRDTVFASFTQSRKGSKAAKKNLNQKRSAEDRQYELFNRLRSIYLSSLVGHTSLLCVSAPFASLRERREPYSHLMIRGWQHKGSFVLKFKPETDVVSGKFEGRIEHVGSGETIRFASPEEGSRIFWVPPR